MIGGTGAPLTGAVVDVYTARTTTHVTVYAAESGGGTLSNPVTSSNGTIPGWVDEAELDLKVSGAGLTTTTKRFNAVLGGNPALAADSVTAAQIAASAVGASEIADGSVGSAELAGNAVIAGKIADGAVNNATKFGAGVVDATALGANAVTTVKILDLNVTTPKLADLAVTAAKIANDTITATQVAPNAIGASELADDAVDNAAIGNLAVDTAELANTSVTSGKLGANAVTDAKIGLSPLSNTAGGSVNILATYSDIVNITTGQTGTFLFIGSVVVTGFNGAPGNNIQVRLNGGGGGATGILGKSHIDSNSNVSVAVAFPLVVTNGATAVSLQAAKETGGGAGNDWQASAVSNLMAIRMGS